MRAQGKSSRTQLAVVQGGNENQAPTCAQGQELAASSTHTQTRSVTTVARLVRVAERT